MCLLQTEVQHGNLNTWSACTGRPVKRDVAFINVAAWRAPSRRVKNLHGSNYHAAFSKDAYARTRVRAVYIRIYMCIYIYMCMCVCVCVCVCVCINVYRKTARSPGSLDQTLFLSMNLVMN